MLSRLQVAMLSPADAAPLTRTALMVQDLSTKKIVKIACALPGTELAWVGVNEIKYPHRQYRIVVGIVSILGELLSIDVEEGAQELPKSQGSA